MNVPELPVALNILHRRAFKHVANQFKWEFPDGGCGEL
jgi:hypothetical protein